MSYKRTLQLQRVTSQDQDSDLKAIESGALINYSLLYIAAGEVQMDSLQTPLKAGELVLLSSKNQQISEKSDDYDIWQLSFCAGCMLLNNQASLTRHFLQSRQGQIKPIKLASQQKSYVELLLEKLHQQTQDIASSEFEQVRSLIILILAEVDSATLSNQQSLIPHKVLAALAFIERHYKQPISLKEVAAHVHSSASHLATLVKTHSGFSVGQWIALQRLTEASRLLTHSQDSIDQIAERTGWGDTTHFIRQFKKFKGKTPLQWRKSELAARV